MYIYWRIGGWRRSWRGTMPSSAWAAWKRCTRRRQAQQRRQRRPVSKSRGGLTAGAGARARDIARVDAT